MNHTPGFRLSPVSLLQVACVFGASGPLQASPTGGEVTAGAANIIGAGGTTTIHQSSDRAIIHWRDFSIGAGESVNFIMPSAGSAVLNRVTGSNVSTLDGHLASNGQVYLINPNGIVIGSSGVVATQGFVAGTGAVLDGEFLEGRRMTFSGATGRVVNSGTIDAGQGNVVLMAREIDQKGSITAGGSVALGAGTEVTLTREGDGGMSVRVSGEGKIDQSGTIEAARAELRAAGGNPYSLAINHDGVTRATGAVKSGGKVVLTGGKGGVRIGGKVQASGGKVDITGKRVELAATAEVDVSGEKGGGTIRVGGGFGGKAPELDNAEEVEVHEGARLAADALESGDGGRIAVWSDHSTVFRGGLSVRGAGTSGAGGFAEVSSAGLLDFTGTALLGGSGGMNGTLLLDPTDLTIGAAQAGSIVSSLASGNVVVATSGSGAGAGNLTVNSAITYTSANDLFFLAHGNIRVNATVRNAGTGDITAIAGWDGTTGADGSLSGAGFLANAGSYGNNSGSIFIGSSTQTTATSLGSKDGDLFLGGSNLTVSGGNTANAFSQIGWNAVDQGAAAVVTGDIVLALKGALALQAGSANRTNAQIGHGGATSGDSTSTVDGTFSGNISATVAGATTLSASAAATAYAQIGHGGLASLGGKSGSISLQTGSLSAISGESFASYTAIGHGGTTSDSPAYSGDITVRSAGNITLTSGTSQLTSARIGHGGLNTTGAGGRIEVTALDLLMKMKTGGQAISQIGHGGPNSRGTYDGDVALTARDITMDTTGQGSIALIGHGGGLSGNLSGDVTVQARDVSMFVTNFNGGAMQIGHLSASGSMTGTTTLIARDISMRAGGIAATARVGMGFLSGNSSADATGDVVVIGRNLTMVGGSESSARIGHGGSIGGIVQGDIDITISGESSLAAGLRGVPIIGHGTTTPGGERESTVTFTTGTLDDSTTATATSVTLRTHVLQVFQQAGQVGNVTVTATGLNGNDGLLVLDEASTGFSPYTMTFASTRDLTVNQPVTFHPTFIGNIRLLFGQNAGGTLRLNAAASTSGSGNASITGGLFDDTVILGNSGTVDGTIDGGGGVNTLTGDANANAFVINGSNSGTLAGKTSGWLNFSNLSGEGGNDSFTFTNTGSLNGSITGGAGSNTLTGDADGDEFVATGANSGSLTGKTGAWSGIQTLNGAAGVDRFLFVSGGGVGVVNGMGGSDLLQLSDTGGLATITGINSGTYLPITGGWSNIENLTGGLGADVFSFTNTGRLDGVIIGGGGTDLLRGDSDGNQFSVSSAEGGTLDGKLSGWSGISSLEGGAGNDSFSFTNTGSLTGSIIGGAGSNTVTGDTDGNQFVISGSNSGMMDGKVGSWSGIQTLNGGAGPDRFTFGEAGTLGTINGGGGDDTLQLPDSGGQVTITGINNGIYLPQISNRWIEIENLAGGTGADVFDFSNAGSLTGSIVGGGGGDVLRGDDDGNRFTMTSAGSGTLEGKLSSWSGIAALVGGAGADTLTGSLLGDEMVVSGNNAGSVTGLLQSWSGIEHLAGGDGDDVFRFSESGVLSGSLAGNAGSNGVIAPDSGGSFALRGLNRGQLTGRVGSDWSDIQDLTGGSGDDLFYFLLNSSISGRVRGGGGNNTLQGEDFGDELFIISGENSGSLLGKVADWAGIATLRGGAGADEFLFEGGSLVGGIIHGGAGGNTLRVAGTTGASFVITGPNQGRIAGLVDSWTGIGSLVGSNGDDRFEFMADASLNGFLNGGGGLDTLAVSQAPAHFVITGENSGHLGALLPAWDDIEILEGSTGDDRFELWGSIRLISGMGGTDTLVRHGVPANYVIDGHGTGSVDATRWQGIENLVGDMGRDLFRFIGAGRIDGLLDGKGGINQLDYSEADSSVDVDLVAGTATRTGGIAGIAEVIGSAFADLLRGGPLASLLDGGADDDVFVVRSGDQDGAAMTVIGGGGSDQLTLDFSDSLLDSTMRMMDGTLSRQWALGNEEYSFEGISLVRLIAGAGSDRVETAGFAFAQDLDGGGGTNTLVLDGRGQGVVDPTSPVAIGDSGLITHINFGTVDVTNATTPDEVRAIIAASFSSFDLAERADLLRFLWFLESTVQAERRGGFRYIDSDGKPLDVMADSLNDQ